MNPENFQFKKLPNSEEAKLQELQVILGKKPGVKVKNGPDVFEVTVEDKDKKEITYGFTKVGKYLSINGKDYLFSEVVRATVQAAETGEDYKNILKEYDDERTAKELLTGKVPDWAKDKKIDDIGNDIIQRKNIAENDTP